MIRAASNLSQKTQSQKVYLLALKEFSSKLKDPPGDISNPSMWTAQNHLRSFIAKEKVSEPKAARAVFSLEEKAIKSLLNYDYKGSVKILADLSALGAPSRERAIVNEAIKVLENHMDWIDGRRDNLVD